MLAPDTALEEKPRNTMVPFPFMFLLSPPGHIPEPEGRERRSRSPGGRVGRCVLA